MKSKTGKKNENQKTLGKDKTKLNFFPTTK